MAKIAGSGVVKVALKCVYSDGKDNPGPGTVIDLDAEEAERLFDLGAAEPYAPPAKPADE